ncbi:MAG: tRNA preQ1(34) S-adenosylmethionine ribosyltransferase-isomerase QueA [Clostridia bacterium]|nr:tRNA preQ1(34) S-adenosylmethionine ribosyltransferase-isomerase QueA [Clostridia bacterium]
MDVDIFDFDLPQKLIAQTPLSDRSSSRLLVLNRKTGQVNHKVFSDIKSYLKQGDCLVLNDTKVIPARLYGVKENSDRAMEVLLLKRGSDDVWECIMRPARKVKIGERIIFGNNELACKVISVDETGSRFVKFEYEGIFEEILDRLGEMPLPPYITEKLQEKDRYQTVYAKHSGSAAAPTAGLHFTKELLAEIENMGVDIAYVTLHVGLGTFRPVKAEKVEEHIMHSEHYIVPSDTAEKIMKAKSQGGRVIAVGTTSARTLETVGEKDGVIRPCSGDTSIFIYPGKEIKVLDGLITNFHLPKSTLIMLVSAFAGRENVLNAYNEAIEKEYRFFSFGDAMFIE